LRPHILSSKPDFSSPAIIRFLGKPFRFAINPRFTPYEYKQPKIRRDDPVSRENAFSHFLMSGIMYLLLYLMQEK